MTPRPTSIHFSAPESARVLRRRTPAPANDGGGGPPAPSWLKSTPAVIGGSGWLTRDKQDELTDGQLALMNDGGKIKATAGGNGMRFLLVSGKPLKEPVAWYGPIVMNTQAELDTAFEEFNNGTFIKHRRIPNAK